MWRRLASVCLLWVGLSGLLPAALACTMDMPAPMEECCPDHGDSCNDRAPVTPEQLECCALEAPGPIAAAGSEKAQRALIDDLPDDAADRPGSSAFSCVAHPRREAHRPSRALRLDQSSLWLQTARLRL